MTLLNRLLHNAPTCRARVEEDDRFGIIFSVEPDMLVHSEVDKSSSVRAVIMNSSVEDPSPDDRYFFRPQLIPDRNSDGASVIIPADGISKLGLEDGDTIVYILAPADAFGKLDGPLEDLGTPVRDSIADRTGRASGPKEPDEVDEGDRPPKRDVVATNSDHPLWASGQITAYSDMRNQLGAVAGDTLSVEITHNETTATFEARLGSTDHISVPKAIQDKLRVDADRSTGDNRIKFDTVKMSHPPRML